MGDRRHARQRRHARALRRRARLPGPDRLWAFVERHRVNVLGVSPTLIRALMAHGDEPVRAHDLSSLRDPRVDRRAVERRPVALVLRRRRRRSLPGHQHLGRHRGRRVLPVAARRRSRCRRARSAARRSAWPSTCSTTPASPVRGEVGELVCTKPWPGMTRGLVPRSASATSRRTGRAGPTCGGTATSRASPTTGSGSCTAAPTTRSSSRASGSGPAEVETVVVAHPRVVEAAAVGVPDELKGEALWVFVVLAPGRRRRRRAARRDLERASPTRSARRSSPRQVRFTSALPKTRSAKVLRRAIRAIVTGDAPGDLSGLEDPGDARRDRGERLT